MASPSDLPIILYHYDRSPYAKRVVWYLNLRKIPYSQCIQPAVMPRPDLVLLGVSYRRIPVLSIGRDIYLDTRLILQKLETLYPPSAAHPGIGAHSPEHKALEQLISARVIDGDVFNRGAQCLPAKAYAGAARDRAALAGIDMDKPGAVSPFSQEVLSKQRPEALAAMRRWVRWLEEGLLADGRNWVLTSPDERAGGPSLADIEAVWVLHWVSKIPGALPSDILGAESAPKVYAWIKRFDDAVAGQSPPPHKIASLSGEDAANIITSAPFAEPEGEVLPRDPVVEAGGLRKGTPVRMWPTDYGSSHKDTGNLISINDTEFVIEARGTGAFGSSSVRIHAPRHGFKTSKIVAKAASKM
ncbi:glutathione S-transferase [Xylariaceae sp. AK1471]|nr:glutathione S-transferase [Xylariaceae sp. AK1471]